MPVHRDTARHVRRDAGPGPLAPGSPAPVASVRPAVARFRRGDTDSCGDLIMTDSLLNRMAVVTGAARGIGRACAVALARSGADIVGIDIAGPVNPILDFPPRHRR